MVIPLNGIDMKMLRGIGMGVFSGFSFAVLAIMNKKISSSVSGIKLTFYQCLGASFWSIPVLLLWNKMPSVKDVFFMLILGVIFTGIAHTLFVMSLKRISARHSECHHLPRTYDIVFATFILGEILGLKIVLGSGLIILAAVSATKTTVLKDRPAL